MINATLTEELRALIAQRSAAANKRRAAEFRRDLLREQLAKAEEAARVARADESVIAYKCQQAGLKDV